MAFLRCGDEEGYMAFADGVGGGRASDGLV